MKYEIKLSTKEAINILKNDFKDCPEFCSLNDCDLCCAEATKMAIEALEKQIAMGNETHYGECAGLEQ